MLSIEEFKRLIEEFKKLKRNDMFVKLAASAPDLVKGKTRARKEELVDIYEVTLLKQVIAEEKDTHTQATEEAFKANTKTGRFPSDEPNLQNTPLRTDEARELRNAFVEANQPSTLTSGFDLGSLEMRMAAALLNNPQTPEERQPAHTSGFGSVAQGVSDAYDREKPYGSGMPRNAAVLRGEEHVVGRRSSRMVDSPIGVAVSRKAIVERAMAKLGRDKLQVIANYKRCPTSDRKRRRLRQALHRRIMKFLPKGITIDEAMAVLP